MKSTIGILFITISILIAFSNLTIVGAVVGISISNSLSWIAIVFFIVGILFVVREEKEGNLALKVMESGAVIDNSKRLKRIANKMGYGYKKVKEGYKVLGEDGKPLTVIPNGYIPKGLSRGILRALATGKSSFRRRPDYSYG